MLFGTPSVHYTVTVPAEKADVDSITRLAGETFGESTIDPTTIYDAYCKNPYCHLVAKDDDNNIVGYLDFFLLRPAMFDAFVEGSKAEGHFESDDILAYGDPAAGNRVYMGGIAAFTHISSERGRIVQVLLNGMARLMLEKYLPDDDTLLEGYATSYSEEGRRLLEKLGFVRLNDGSQRYDKQPLYLWKMTRKVMQDLASRYSRAERQYTLRILDR